MSDDTRQHGLMISGMKSLMFLDYEDHGPECLMNRAKTWLCSHNDWIVADMCLGFTVNGVRCLRVYVEDRANPAQVIEVLEEPELLEHNNAARAAAREMVMRLVFKTLPPEIEDLIRRAQEQGSAFGEFEIGPDGQLRPATPDEPNEAEGDA